ncbi:MAG: GC-type dockerin domain-anchored protein [Planctomycetota bacterium]|nr:GC-type dockerin domain-anchored protein [Planctomycetota bacterium]
MKSTTGLFATLALVGFAGLAQAQTPGPVTNGSFEQLNVFSGSGEPTGWHNLSNPNNAVRRTIGDGGSPAAVARTGTASIELKNGSAFAGFTTDTLDFATFLYYNPVIDWSKGDIIVTGYYNIPASAPMSDRSGLKIELRFPWSQTVWSWEDLGATGTTNGQWVKFDFRLTKDVMVERFNFGVAQGWFQATDVPNMISILPLRFGDTPKGGTIFWDDISFVQEDAAPVCKADFNNDGFLDFTDFDDFVGAFEAGNASSDFNGDGFLDFTDFDAFVSAFEAGC